MRWLGGRDSNPDSMVQSHMSYRWTTSQQDGPLNIAEAPGKTQREPHEAGRARGSWVIAFLFIVPTMARAETPVPKDSLQMVLSVSPDWNDTRADLRRYERDSAGAPWRAVGRPFGGSLGESGMAWGVGLHTETVPGPVKKEGDGRSPAGVYRLGEATGYASAAPPGTRLPYREATPTLRCVDDPRSAHYNRLVDEAQTRKDWTSAEDMRRKDDLYRLVIWVGHNDDPPKTGAGSCIFLHFRATAKDIDRRLHGGGPRGPGGASGLARSREEARARAADGGDAAQARGRLGSPAGMKGPRHDPAQRFTCARCTRCCRHFDVAVTEEEAHRLRRPDFARLWSEGGSGPPEGGASGPEAVEPLPGGLVRVRRRRDGACGFLGEDGACRIHAVHGADQKPLACRIFPFRVHPTEGPALVTASFSCPTVARNEGEPVSTQVREMGALVKEWRRAFPETPAPLRFAGSRELPAAVAGEMKAALQALLDRRAADGRRDLRANVARMATLVDDWTRHRVLSLEDDAFADYVRLTGRFAATSDQPASVGLRAASARPSALGRLLRRGFLLAVVAGRLAGEWSAPGTPPPPAQPPRPGRPPPPRPGAGHRGPRPPRRSSRPTRSRRARNPRRGPPLPALHPRDAAHRPGASRRRAGLRLRHPRRRGPACGRAARAGEGRTAITADDLVAGLAEAADLGQAGTQGALGRFLGSLTGGIDALRAFAATPEGGTA